MPDPLRTIADKIDAGQRLDAADGAVLFETPDLWTLGELANTVRRAKHGDAAYYNVNRHLNYSNVCLLSCKFCEFARKPGQDGAYAFTVDQIAEKGRDAQARGATEMHTSAGCTPSCPSTTTSRCSARSRPKRRGCTSRRSPPSRSSTWPA